MTKKYKFSQIREAHNEFEAFLRIKGIFSADNKKCVGFPLLKIQIF